MEKNENWKEIPGFEGLYLVSPVGEVWSVKADRMLKPGTSTSGYRQITLRKGGLSFGLWIHRLVALAWLPIPEELNGKKAIIDHIDFDRTNNSVENLRWVSYGQNNQHTIDNGRIAIKRGSDVNTAKLTEEQVLEIRRRPVGKRGYMRLLAEEFGVVSSTISKIRSGHYWKHI